MKAPYDAIAQQWTKARCSFRPKEEAYLAVLLETANKQLPILDLGCGSGRPIAELLVRSGYRVVGVDASKNLLAEAKKIVPAAMLIRSKIEDVSFDETFGAVVCWDALFHLERQLHQTVFERVHRWLVPGGRFMFSSGGSVEALPAFTDTMWGEDFSYDSHTPEEVKKIVELIGFGIVLFDFAELPDGRRNKGKLALIAEKKKPPSASQQLTPDAG
jgi:cyclopropane fatty-acyl-phospholipid synthase-like methyltransferase